MEIGNVKIKASEGMMLTNGNAYAKSVALGVADSPNNWSEITVDEYLAITQAEELGGE